MFDGNYFSFFLFLLTRRQENSLKNWIIFWEFSIVLVFCQFKKKTNEIIPIIKRNNVFMNRWHFRILPSMKNCLETIEIFDKAKVEKLPSSSVILTAKIFFRFNGKFLQKKNHACKIVHKNQFLGLVLNRSIFSPWKSALRKNKHYCKTIASFVSLKVSNTKYILLEFFYLNHNIG